MHEKHMFVCMISIMLLTGIVLSPSAVFCNIKSSTFV